MLFEAIMEDNDTLENISWAFLAGIVLVALLAMAYLMTRPEVSPSQLCEHGDKKSECEICSFCYCHDLKFNECPDSWRNRGSTEEQLVEGFKKGLQ